MEFVILCESVRKFIAYPRKVRYNVHNTKYTSTFLIHNDSNGKEREREHIN